MDAYTELDGQIDLLYMRAAQMRHGHIIKEALDRDIAEHGADIDVDLYCETCHKIELIELNYTDDEIMHGNLLCDIW